MIDYKLNKKDKSVLEQYEVHLKRAVDGYVRGIYTTDLDVLTPIYAKFGLQLENKHCSTCVLGMMKFLATQYYK